MPFEFGTAAEVDATLLARLSHAMRRTGRPVVLVPLGPDVHGGHLALTEAAHRLRGAVTVVAVDGEAALDAEPGTSEIETQTPDLRARLAACGADAVFHLPADDPALSGRTRVLPVDRGLEPVGERARELTRILALLGASQATDVFIGEKDYELLVDVQHAVTDLHLPVHVHGFPTVRMPDGLALSLRNAQVPPEMRERAIALSAALTAGAHVAEDGAEAVLETAGAVLEAAGVTPEYLELRSHLLGEPPAEGDARLLVAARFDEVRLTDNVGVPLGVGFRGLAEQSG